LERREAYSRKSNLEIHGVKQSQDENVSQIAIQLFTYLGIHVRNEEIIAAHRYDTFKERERPIIVKLSTSSKKDEIIRATWLKRPIKTEEVFPHLPQGIIYNMTPLAKKTTWHGTASPPSCIPLCWSRRDEGHCSTQK